MDESCVILYVNQIGQNLARNSDGTVPGEEEAMEDVTEKIGRNREHQLSQKETLMQKVGEGNLLNHGDEEIRCRTKFRVHSSFLAIKNGRRGFHSLKVGDVGEIVGVYDGPGRPGLVMIRVRHEFFLTWSRDLDENTDAAHE